MSISVTWAQSHCVVFVKLCPLLFLTCGCHGSRAAWEASNSLNQQQELSSSWLLHSVSSATNITHPPLSPEHFHPYSWFSFATWHVNRQINCLPIITNFCHQPCRVGTIRPLRARLPGERSDFAASQEAQPSSYCTSGQQLGLPGLGRWDGKQNWSFSGLVVGPPRHPYFPVPLEFRRSKNCFLNDIPAGSREVGEWVNEQFPITLLGSQTPPPNRAQTLPCARTQFPKSEPAGPPVERFVGNAP